MPFVKVQKSKAYYKRYQVKFRRRRAGKTDYYARKKMTIQAKNKYASPKYRLVVRCTGSQIICQIVYATIAGDITLASAYSKELTRFGLKAGFKNYSAAYCTGLLVARRVLKKIGLFEKYTGVGDDEEDEVTGEIISITEGKRKYFVDELAEDGRRPMRVTLDIGLARTSLGAKIFGALKGASDGGLDIPHNYKKFPGYDPEEKDYDASAHRDQIFGEHVAEYMRFLEQEDEESGTSRLKEQFRTYVDAGVTADDLEDMYIEVHKAIRADPSPKSDKSAKERQAAVSHDKKFKRPARKTYEQRRKDVEAKLEKIKELQGESSEEEESDEE